MGTAPDSIALYSNGAASPRAAVTLAGSDQLMILNTSGTPTSLGVFNLPAATQWPREITVAPNTASGTKDYAYIAKQVGGIQLLQTCSNATGGATTTVTCTISTAANHTVMVFVIQTAASTGSAKDSHGNTYTELTGANGNCSVSDGTNVSLQCFVNNGGAGASVASTSITFTTATSTHLVIAVAEYTGVTGVGASNKTTNAAATSVTLTDTGLSSNNDVCIAGFGYNAVNTGGAAFTNPNSLLLAQAGLAGGTRTLDLLVTTVNPNSGTCTVGASETGGNEDWAQGIVDLTSTSQPGVDVVDLTTDPTGSLTVVTSITEPAASEPFSIAVTPAAMAGETLNSVYVGLPGSTQFDVLDNTQSPPVQIGADLTTTTNPVGGVAIPPFTSPAAIIYFTLPAGAPSSVAPYTDGAPPTVGTVINVQMGSEPGKLRTIPIPQ